MVDIVESMRSVCGNPKASRDGIDYALAFGIDEITRLRAEAERLKADSQALKASLRDHKARHRKARAEAFERAAQIAENAILSVYYDWGAGHSTEKPILHREVIAAYIRQASKDGGE